MFENTNGLFFSFIFALFFLIIVGLSLIFKTEQKPVLSDYDVSFNTCIGQGGVPVVNSGFLYKNAGCVFKNN